MTHELRLAIRRGMRLGVTHDLRLAIRHGARLGMTASTRLGMTGSTRLGITRLAQSATHQQSSQQSICRSSSIVVDRAAYGARRSAGAAAQPLDRGLAAVLRDEVFIELVRDIRHRVQRCDELLALQPAPEE